MDTSVPIGTDVTHIGRSDSGPQKVRYQCATHVWEILLVSFNARFALQSFIIAVDSVEIIY